MRCFITLKQTQCPVQDFTVTVPPTHARGEHFFLAHANICACLSPFVSTCVCLVYYLYKDLGQGCANQRFDSVVNEKSVIVVSLDSSLRACVE